MIVQRLYFNQPCKQTTRTSEKPREYRHRSAALKSLSKSTYKKYHEAIRQSALRHVADQILESIAVPAGSSKKYDALLAIMLAMGHANFRIDLNDSGPDLKIEKPFKVKQHTAS